MAAPLAADLVHRACRLLVTRHAPAHPELALEAFPKQGKVEPDRLGNLVKLPLGIHRRSGRRAVLLDEAGFAVADPWPLIAAQPRINREALVDAMADHASAPDEPSLDAHPALEKLRDGCAVLALLIAKARDERRLTHDEQIVLAHSLGHLEDGPALVNAAYACCPEIPRHAWLGKTFRGHPISCAKVRQRIPAVTARVPCHCLFPDMRGSYPNPLLHLGAPLGGA